MNTVRLQEVLSQRYNTHWTGLRNKLLTRYIGGAQCSYCNHLSSRPVGQTMQKTLKAKIQNALSLSSPSDAESPALFVGGRRRNRKKRKNKNGQAKRKAKKGVATEAPPRVVTPSTPDDSAYEDLLPIYSVRKPVVSCLDIREPVFDHMLKSASGTEEEHDCVYNSNDSLVSHTSGHDSAIEQDDDIPTTDNELVVEEVVSEDKKLGFPRSNSEDSGVYDSGDDVGYGGEIAVDNTEEIDDQITDDAFENDTTSDESVVAVFKYDDQVIDCDVPITDPEEKHQDDFDEIDLTDEQEQDCTVIENEDVADTIERVSVEDVTEDEDKGFDNDTLENIREMKSIPEAISFVNFVHPEDEDEIIFDLSQLEVNNTKEEISRIPRSNGVLKLSEVLDGPTDLEEGASSFRVPMDLLIEDDDTEEVLFEAAAATHTRVAAQQQKKETVTRDLSITCNPLYEHTLREEEDRLSIKSYQSSGFKTDFDNINLIQIPTSTSSKTYGKPLKESSPLMKRQEGRDDPDELACCVIL